MIQNRKILFIICAGVIILLLLVIFLFASAKNPKTSSDSSNQLPQLSLTPAPTDAQKEIEAYPLQPEESALQKEQTFYKNNRPDIYLSNLLPIQNDDFTIERKLDQDGIVLFTITSKSASLLAAQESFGIWAKSNGLSSDQINSLRITYK